MVSDPRYADQKYLNELLDWLQDKYGESDALNELCFKLGVESGGLSGDSPSGKVLALVQYLKRHDRIQELVKHCSDEFSDAQRFIIPAATSVVPREEYGVYATSGSVALDESRAVSPQLREAVRSCQDRLKRAHGHINVLGDYKDMHIQLQELQAACYDPIIYMIAPNFPRDARAIGQLRQYPSRLRSVANRMRKVANRGSFATFDIRWIEQVDEAQEKLHNAIERHDKQELNRATEILYSEVLSFPPMKINGMLTSEARALGQCELVERMTLVQDILNSQVGPKLDTQKINTFVSALSVLRDLHDRLTDLVEEHNQWQSADFKLRMMETLLDDTSLDDAGRIVLPWKTLKKVFEELYSTSTEDWAVELKTSSEELTNTINAQNPAEIRVSFVQCRACANSRFTDVDYALKDLCIELREKLRKFDALITELIT